MAYYFNEPSHTFGEYLLVPGYSSSECIPSRVSLKTPLVKFKKGEEPAISMNIPMVSAIMQSVSDDRMAIALAKEGGVSFIYGSQSIESEAAMVSRVKNYKAGFVVSDSNIRPDDTLADVLALKEKNGHSTMAVTEDGTSNGKLLGIVTSRDYRVSRMSPDTKVSAFMTPFDRLICGNENTTLKEANDIIWEHKLNSLPLVDQDQHLLYLVFRKDYDSRKENPLELLDENKSYVVGAGVNTRDYEQRIPALVEAGADVLCIDSSEGFSEWQSRTIQWVREKYGDTVKIGAGNVVDREGFLFLAQAGADFIKVGIGGGSICITRETKGIGRGQATAVIEVAKARDEYYEATGIYIPICSDGGIVHDYHITLALAMGADAVAIASAALIAAACQQYRICGTGNCPVGIATQNPELRARLDVDKAAQRVANFLNVSLKELKTFARVTGHTSVHDLSVTDLVTLDRDIAAYTDIPFAGASPAAAGESTPTKTKEAGKKMKFVCKICGYVYEGETAPEQCPQCKQHGVMEPVPVK